jgi:hypothetical protein
MVQRIPTQGKTPRHFAADPAEQNHFVEGRKYDNGVVFRIDSNSGKLFPTGRVLNVSTPPACVCCGNQRNLHSRHPMKPAMSCSNIYLKILFRVDPRCSVLLLLQ